MLLTRLAFVALFLVTLLPSAYAQANRQPSTEEIVRMLSGDPASPKGTTKSRGRRGVTVEGGSETSIDKSPKSIDLEVNFEYNSSLLSPDARIVLDNLGRALKKPELAASKFVIAGHTDGKGTDAYNLELSRQRAKSVAEYLSRTHAVSLSRLVVKGYGKQQLLDTSNPENPINRRVQVTNLGN
jgi:outer membrane protein OmpA-like peptidoglycan-associated protein